MSYIFGPVRSRRLGLSLGVDVVPAKTCNYDCLYCECGRTQTRINQMPECPDAVPIKAALNDFLAEYHDEKIDYITITGSGEPTINENLADIIKAMRHITTIPIAVLTNGSFLNKHSVQEAVGLADLVIPSLDAVDESIFQKINRPCPGLHCIDMINGIVQYRRRFPNQKMCLEILLVEGVNDGDSHLRQFVPIVEQIKPDRIDICTVIRPPAYQGIQSTSWGKMEYLKELLGEQAHIMVSKQEPCLHRGIITKERLVAILRRRPSRLDDLIAEVEEDAIEIERVLTSLIEEKILTKRIYNDLEYYCLDNTQVI
ncbi:MAG: radical SAM protein [Chlamydiota bacterium]|nr:radical SAM protein [Chlamydiota bacterium]